MIPRAAYAMSETQLMEHIRDACGKLGLLAFHVRDSRGSWGAGFPDLVVSSRRGTLFAECKRQGENLRPDQRRWRDALIAGGMAYRLWRPASWLDGSIVNDLLKLSPLPVAVFTGEDIA